jgi:Domain of unknown function (DUF3841)
MVCLPNNPTREDVCRLINAPASEPITLWTMQQPGADQQLRESGQFAAEPKYSFDVHGKPGKRFAYSWMQEQMRRRLAEYSGQLPIWALLSRPSRCTRPGDILLRVEIPKERMLICFYKPWTRLLEIMSCLESECAWPPLGVQPYLAACIGDKRQSVPNEQECRASWEKMFDLTLIQHAEFCWGYYLQAILPALYESHVRDRTPMT